MIGKPWLLSIISGLIAVLIYYLCMPKDNTVVAQNEKKIWNKSNTKIYLGIFIVVSFLVYGSFMISLSTGECKLIEENIEIQTGGRPPF
tara:strand:+ start:541 stop:807 length:267 start_codon:yes stop_codon:yes gene_type:complete